MKSISIVLFFMCFSNGILAQSVPELEYELKVLYNGEVFGDKVDLARLLQSKDPFNQVACEYICRYYNLNKIDSIPLFFKDLKNEFPDSAEPYVLHQQLLGYEDAEVRFVDREFYLRQVDLLNKAIVLDSLNLKANYYLADI